MNSTLIEAEGRKRLKQSDMLEAIGLHTISVNDDEGRLWNIDFSRRTVNEKWHCEAGRLFRAIGNASCQP
ncbi:hypothetical protein [Hymenobacter cheonanensis]|uniref:hypothetical protein n=1 Tax=Hymenobacter sp. CA2-7 TaxID=3063993 RepID=UPI0027126A2A|nr:hypothetical protein [Hymenobacter sp. CA2-7]MDO7888161.1 hypothetical protein [Hymenobacter sp. CA2-7]